MFLVETFETRENFVCFSLAEPKWKAEAILKTFGLMICGDIHYTTNSFCKKALKVVTP